MREIFFEEWLEWARAGHRNLPAGLVHEGVVARPPSWEPFWDSPVSVLLESARGGSHDFLVPAPACAWLGDDAGAVEWAPDADGNWCPRGRIDGAPLDVIERLRNAAAGPRIDGWPAFQGGLAGVLGYDLAETWERLSRKGVRDAGLPLYAMAPAAELLVFEPATGRLGALAWTPVDGAPTSVQFESARARCRALLDRWTAACAAPAAPIRQVRPGMPPPPSFTPEGFAAAARRILEYIAAGDTYQVNLSLRSSRATRCTPEAIYETLRRANPSPYMGLLRMPGFSLVCGSPELLVRQADDLVESRPIAGTRPRGPDRPDDAAMQAELLATPKERAEHLMLVDLIRNDTGHVAEPGTVRVTDFMCIERYSHVMHIVSHVVGRLRKGLDWRDTLRSFFPGGTITGCPKLRTMEIIEELEPVGRGFYTGSLGWLAPSGDMELNIVIRSIVHADGVVHVQAGAGVVADSVPEREYDESMRKARAPWMAVELAEEALDRPADA